MNAFEEKFNFVSWKFREAAHASRGRKPSRVLKAEWPSLADFVLGATAEALLHPERVEFLTGDAVAAAYDSGVQSCMRGRGRDAAGFYGKLEPYGFGVVVVRAPSGEIIARAVVRNNPAGGVLYVKEYGCYSLSGVLKLVEARRVEGEEFFSDIPDGVVFGGRWTQSLEKELHTFRWVDHEERSDAWRAQFEKIGGKRFRRATLAGGVYTPLPGWDCWLTRELPVVVREYTRTGAPRDFYVDGLR